MRNVWVLPSIAVILLAAAPFEAQKIDPLTGKVVEQAPPPEPATADLSEANEKVKAQDYAGAEALLATLQEQFPEDPALLALRGELLVALGRIDEAIPVLQEVAELDPESARVQFQLGTALASNGNRPAAIDAFGKAVDLSEEPRLRFLARMNRSVLFQHQRQWSAAAAELEAALELDPSRSEAWADLATLYLDAEDLDRRILERRPRLGRILQRARIGGTFRPRSSVDRAAVS